MTDHDWRKQTFPSSAIANREIAVETCSVELLTELHHPGMIKFELCATTFRPAGQSPLVVGCARMAPMARPTRARRRRRWRAHAMAGFWPSDEIRHLTKNVDIS